MMISASFKNNDFHNIKPLWKSGELGSLKFASFHYSFPTITPESMKSNTGKAFMPG